MIVDVKQIQVPESGKYKEVVYDIQSSWNSQEWTWLKFTNDEYDEWCGQFRGKYRGYGISKRDACIYILTSDYIFLLDINSGKLLISKDRPMYQKLTISPLGDCIVADYYSIEVIDSSLSTKYVFESEIQLDMIVFSKWMGNTLIIHADEICNWDNHIVLSLDTESFKLSIISETSKGVNR